ncbi:hypothetical protein Misp03_13400 [Microbispora sp. NBRC 16548]|nr:hypothetical protein Misp03_13400 [Microbispora sp. NBRC 16548]
MAKELAGSLAAQALAPAASQEPVSEFGLSFDRALVGTRGWLQKPPADEPPIHETDPEAEPRDVVRGGEPLTMEDLHLFTATCTPGDVAHDLRIGVEFDLVLEVFVGQRNKRDAVGPQYRLRHGGDCPA